MNRLISKTVGVNGSGLRINAKEFDLKIYEDPQSDCNRPADGTLITKNCAPSMRLCVGTRYLNAIKMSKMDEEEKKNLYVEFNEVIYTNVLEDTTHFVREHGEDIQQVQKEWTQRYGLPMCSVSECAHTARHYGRGRSDRNNEQNDKREDTVYSFYESLYDRVHHFIFHLFDIGMRVDVSSLTMKEEDSSEFETAENELFAAERDHIKLLREECNVDLDRLNDANNKFSIQTVNEKQGTTQLDAVHKVLNGIVSGRKLQSIHHFLNENAFDSDCVELDLEDAEDSNLAPMIQNQSVINTVKEFMRNINLIRRSFSTGFIFDYKNKDNKMFVKQRYQSLKEEILESGFLTLSDWKKCVEFKGRSYLKLEAVKNMKVTKNRWDSIGPKSLQEGAPVELQHLFAIILYCDFGILCTAFSATFRRENVFETEESVISRHSCYVMFGSLLVEMVLSFGLDREDQEGPFYCGINCILNIGSFAICLKGPCSTSTVRAVAHNFADSQGIILKLSNESRSAEGQRFFDCSWISNYWEEKEFLWISGHRALRIVSILIVNNAKSYSLLLRILYLFDAMISGVWIQDDTEMGALECELISNLINVSLENKDLTPLGFDEYLKREWDLYRQNKEEIVLNLYCLDEGFKSLSKLIMFNVVERDDINVNEANGKDNILKPEWLRLFPSLNSVLILDYFAMFNFKLEALLEAIESISPSITVTVIDDDYQWAREALTDEVSAAFDAKGWDIEYDETVEYQVFEVVKGGLVIKSKQK